MLGGNAYDSGTCGSLRLTNSCLRPPACCLLPRLKLSAVLSPLPPVSPTCAFQNRRANMQQCAEVTYTNRMWNCWRIRKGCLLQLCLFNGSRQKSWLLRHVHPQHTLSHANSMLYHYCFTRQSSYLLSPCLQGLIDHSPLGPSPQPNRTQACFPNSPTDAHP